MSFDECTFIANEDPSPVHGCLFLSALDCNRIEANQNIGFGSSGIMVDELYCYLCNQV